MNSPVYDCADYEGVPLLDAAATMDDEGHVTIFAVNRDMAEDIKLEADLRAFGPMAIKEHILLKHSDVKAVNTEENPYNVAPVAGPGGTLENGKLEIVIPALSWNVIRLG